MDERSYHEKGYNNFGKISPKSGLRKEEEGEYDFISCVNFDGYIEMAAQDVEDTNCCIRPAFWLKID